MMFLKRHYNLLEIISHEKRWFSLQEIAETLNCSIKTLQRDLIQIQDKLPLDWTIQVYKNEKIKLHKPISSSISTIRVQYFKQTLLFQALNKILYEDAQTIEQLARSLYIQNTKMRSVLLDIEKHLKLYQLKLKKRPLRIVGNEISLIFMYYELYLKSYHSQEWPFQEFEQGMYIKLLSTIEKMMKIRFYKESIRKLSIFFSLYFIRKSRKHSIFVEQEILDKIKSFPMYKKIFEKIKCFFSQYNIMLNQMDVVILIIVINELEYYYEKNETVKKDYLSYIIKENKQVYNVFTELIQIMETTFDIELLCDEEFIFMALDVTRKSMYKSEKCVEIGFVKPTTIYIKNKHAGTFNKIKNIINNTLRMADMGVQVGDNEIANLTMHIEAIVMQINQKNKKVIVLLSGGTSWERYIKEFLRLYFNRNIEYLDISLNQDFNAFLNANEIACIITDTQLYDHSLNIPVILISNILTKRDLDEIQKFL